MCVINGLISDTIALTLLAKNIKESQNPRHLEGLNELRSSLSLMLTWERYSVENYTYNQGVVWAELQLSVC